MLFQTIVKALLYLLASFGFLLQSSKPKVVDVPTVKNASEEQQSEESKDETENKINILDYTERGIIDRSVSQLKSYYEYIKSGGVVEDPLIPYRPVTNLYQFVKEKISEEKSPEEKSSDVENLKK
jgi:hypothetical protein